MMARIDSRILLFVLTLSLLAVTSVSAQEAPQTSWGTPDLQGVWDFRSITPLQRPEDRGEQEFLSEEEAANLEQAAVDRIEELANKEAERTEAGGSIGAYNDFWMDRGTNTDDTRRTSLITDPANGRLPSTTEAGELRRTQVGSFNVEIPTSYTDLSNADRCIIGFNAGPPMTPGAYNNNMQFFQTPEYVTILTEQARQARVIPLGTPEKPSFAQLAGVSRGHWEGETLVIETTQFRGRENGGTGPHMHLVERLTRLDPDTVAYEYTVTDPTVYTAPYTVMMPFRRTDGPIFEFACHEGNIGLYGMLAGARNLERQGRELRP